jgi:hypothetical protein
MTTKCMQTTNPQFICSRTTHKSHLVFSLSNDHHTGDLYTEDLHSNGSIANMGPIQEPTQEPLTCTNCTRGETKVECESCEEMLYCSAACQTADL